MSRPDFADVTAAAVGRWTEILTGLGIEDEYLTRRHGPCPGCGGTDRFRFDDRDGRGRWLCGQGGDTIAGDGFQLLEHVHGWSRAESLREVACWLGMDRTQAPPPRRPKPAPRPPEPTPTQGYALSIWARVDRESAAVAGHPYAGTKRIGWHAGAGRARVSGKVIGPEADCIVVPIRDLETFDVVGVECLSDRRDAYGKFLRQSFGQKAGGALPLGNRTNTRIPHHVCEGWATGVRLWRALGDVVVYVAFGKSLMEPVAQWLEQRRCQGPVYIAEEADAH